MKRKNIFRIVLLCLAGTLTFGSSLYIATHSFKKEIIVKATSHPDNYDSFKYSGTYYDDIMDNLTEGMNGTLRTALTSLIYPASNPIYSGSSGSIGQLSGALQYADEDPTNSNNMVYFYTRDSVTKNAASSWNREHVWPQSLSNKCWGTSNAGSDILHIRPTYTTTNSKRGNLKYGDVPGDSSLVYNDITYRSIVLRVIAQE